MDGQHGNTDSQDALSIITGWLNAVPVSDHEALFDDFATAVQSRNLRKLLQTITDWASTGEVYATPGMVGAVVAASQSLIDRAVNDPS